MLARTSSQQRNRSYTTGDMGIEARYIKKPSSRKNKTRHKKTRNVVDINQPKIYEVGKKAPGDVHSKWECEECVGADSSICARNARNYLRH